MRPPSVTPSVTIKGAAGIHVVSGVALLRPEEQVFEAMLDGWQAQQTARNLSLATIAARLRVIRAFAEHVNSYPWQWLPQMIDEWSTDLRAVRGLARSTLRGYQEAVRLFCEYLTDPAYGWAGECQRRFGSHPVQVCHEWNTAVHVQSNESDPRKRAFTVDELQALFDHADEQVMRIRGAGRKGWLPAFRDATLLKTAYAYGLRRNEARMLDVVDFSTNPHAPEFGDLGVCHVRHGKAMAGSAPKRRSVLTIWPWGEDILRQWITEVRPLLAHDGNPALWPSERRDRIGLQRINSQLTTYRNALGLGPGLDFHSLRRSYVTHLIEAGWDPLFVQQQAGHEHASTTSIYTCVSSDFRTRTLRAALDQTMGQALPGATG
ncbi:tyrosine-type recombinase/integrase [Micromonospora zamorensis]|uniref:tyrosine-type recombinase/integrase n=1 Tax=Micromonospora zamorensis TaxID=709883 RepID=UPI00082020B5|nr:site-specific integrase [Micromonospora zamorensis]SCG45674.1 Site-specific recombinase XerD [Micromonospora zamorensis]